MRKVKPGDPLQIPAQTWNTFIDVAEAFQRQQHAVRRTPQRDLLNTGILLVRNTSGAARPRFGVLGIAGPVINPDDNLPEFQGQVALRGVVPTAEHVGRFVVLLEPLADGAIGRACVDGLCAARVEVASASDRLADCAIGQAEKLVANPAGTARLLWVAPPTSGYPYTGWAVVQLGCGGSGSTVQWAKITSIVGNTVKAKFADANGNVDPQAEEFVVRLYATDGQGVTWNPALSEASPRLMVDQYLQVVQMPGCGTGRSPGWYMIGPPLSMTCLPTDNDDDLDWLLANVAALRALVEGR